MTTQSSDPSKAPAPDPRRGAAADLPPEPTDTPDLDPAASAADEDDESRLPELTEETLEPVGEGPLATGHAAIENAVRLRSEEHTSELQSHSDLVCRLLLEKKKTK